MSTDNSLSVSGKNAGTGERLGDAPSMRNVFIVLAVYFVWQILARVLVSSTADLDESEQLILTQQFQWGYGSQPPLYSWIQIGFFSAFGISTLALALFKNLLLAGTACLTYANARIITRSHACAVLAMGGLLFIPSVAWESQRDLTHSVLSTTLAAALLFCFLKLCEGNKLRWFTGFGLCAGLGVLAKYNFVYWWAALLIGALTLREFRPYILNWRMLVATLLALAVCLPNLHWVMTHRELALSAANKLGTAPANPLWSLVHGTWGLTVAVISFAGPLVLICAVIFYKAPKQALSVQSLLPFSKLLLRAIVAAGLMLMLGFLFRDTNVRERWLQPVLICAPVLAAALVQTRLDGRRLRWWLRLSLLVMVIIAALIPARVLFAEHISRVERLSLPCAEIAAQMRPHVPPGSLVVTDQRLLGGNLRLNWPDSEFVSTDLVALFPPGKEPCFVVWDTTKRREMPKGLQDWVKAHFPNSSTGQPEYFSATFKYHHARQFEVGLLRVN